MRLSVGRAADPMGEVPSICWNEPVDSLSQLLNSLIKSLGGPNQPLSSLSWREPALEQPDRASEQLELTRRRGLYVWTD